MCTLVLIVSSAEAQEKRFAVDPSASDVAFTLGATLHTVHGVFHVQSAMVKFDPSAPAISGLIVVSAGSGDTGDKGRDRKMQTDVLDAPRFADISFAPHSYTGSIAPTGDSTIQVAGTFTLHGSQHELTVPMQIHIDGTNCTAKTQFAVPYVSWGLKDPSTFVLKVAKEVHVDLTLVGRLLPAS